LVLNTKFEDGKLKAEAWIDKEKVAKVDERVMSALEAGQVMELSTGAFVDVEPEQGQWNDEKYIGIVRNIRPDHVALLPDKKGACSVEDGAGLLRNQKLTKNELSFGDKFDQIRRQLYERFGQNVSVMDLYDDYVVYCTEDYYYKLPYRVVGQNRVKLAEQAPVPVVRVVEYREIGQETALNSNNQRMNEETKLAEAIIAANAGWTEADKAELVKLPKAILERMAQLSQKSVEKEPTESEEIAGTQEPVKNQVTTVEQYVQLAPPEIREVLVNGLSVYREEKAKMIDLLLKNQNNTFKQEELEAWPLANLRRLVRLAGLDKQQATVTINYSGMAPVENPATLVVEQPLELPVLNFGNTTK
jgi:hypothetical protein